MADVPDEPQTSDRSYFEATGDTIRIGTNCRGEAI
jgi:hypothetical protein